MTSFVVTNWYTNSIIWNKEMEIYMRKQRNIILYIGTSIDGYIANADGTLEWLESIEVEGDSDDPSLLERIDTVVMGKGTYDVIRGFDMKYSYSDYEIKTWKFPIYNE
jgi:hypothetical protein